MGKSESNGHSNSFSNGPSGNSGPDQVFPVRHGEFCCCQWCLQGVR